jgi:hypothetical protein
VAGGASQATAPAGAVVGPANPPSFRIHEGIGPADLLAETMSVSGPPGEELGSFESRMPVAAGTTSFPRRLWCAGTTSTLHCRANVTTWSQVALLFVCVRAAAERGFD